MQHHGTSDRMATTGRPTGRSPTHTRAQEARADGHQIVHGRGGFLVTGAVHIQTWDGGDGRGTSRDLLVEEAL